MTIIKKIAMNPQPTKNVEGMWHWKDCQWMDNEIGFPASGIEDHTPVEDKTNVKVILCNDTWFWLVEIEDNERMINNEINS